MHLLSAGEGWAGHLQLGHFHLEDEGQHMDQRCVIKVIFCQAKGLVKCMPDANVNPYLIDLNRLNYQKHNSCSKPPAGFLLHQGFFFQATDCPYPSTTPWFGAWQAEDKNAITVAVQCTSHTIDCGFCWVRSLHQGLQMLPEASGSCKTWEAFAKLICS